MSRSLWIAFAFFAAFGLRPSVLSAAELAPRIDATALEHFEKKVRPLLVNNCYTCHSANTNAKGGLRVDDRNGLIQGGNRGAAVVPGDPEGSLLIQAVRYSDPNLEMPPKKQLSAEQVADLSKWIADGAAWPELRVPVSIGKPNAKYGKLRTEHWAWQPMRETPAPSVLDTTWAKDDLDRFLLAKLEDKGLKPVGDADKRTLIRRVTFDLTGLPPTPDEIERFLADGAIDAFEKVVDRLLATPAFGERWARHWLDVARYGESTGSSRNLPLPHAWRYRDYVIDAFNNDKPYDQFVREQIAGDLLPYSSRQVRDEHVIATGFLALGVKDVNQRFKVRFIMDNVDEQIDTVSRALLATTASCARCHDHKFDPIPTADYYALAGIFRSTDVCAGLRNKMGGGGLDYYDKDLLLRLGPEPTPDSELTTKLEQAKKAVTEAKTEFERLRDHPEGDVLAPDGRPKRAVARQKLNRAQLQLSALTDPAANGGKVALGVRDAKTVGDTEIRIRGEAEKLGPIVPRGFLTLLSIPDAPSVNPNQSGRLELAEWLTSDKNPLTPRVLVNRVWQHLFDQGLVKSVDNFGITGDQPSHPELLDDLALQFVRDGWSVKRLIRKLVLSRAYQLGSETLDSNVAVDPANRLIWRHSPRRLDAEEIRDAILASSGKLDLKRPEGSPAMGLRVVELPNNGPLARRLGDEAQSSLHRSLYLPLLRGLTPRSLEVFDFAEQGMVTGRRETTTVATQALYLLNDPLVRRHSLNLAEHLTSLTDLDDAARLRVAYQRTLGRDPNTPEFARAKGYLARYESAVVERLATKRVLHLPTVVFARNRETGTESAGAKRAAAPVNPDEVIQVDTPVKEETIEAGDPRTAAWASFCQALFGSAEFRYLP
jgi:mono/diheme cytochrome c family protein